MVTPITTLQLRRLEIPRGPIIELMERETGRSFTHEHRHFLADQPVHCGDTLEIHLNGAWIAGRYEWTGQVEDEPTLELPDGAMFLKGSELLRWPSEDE